MEVKINGADERKTCIDCGKRYKHIVKCRDGKYRCKKCIRKQVTNKWFIPKEQRIPETKIGKFNMTLQEKSLLHRQGHSWGEINGACSYMNKEKWFKRKEFWNKINEANRKKEQDNQVMVNLIQGLKQ